MVTSIHSAKYSEAVSHFSPHFHDCHQLLYITEGTAEITINDKVYTVSAGSLVLISRLEMHATTVKSPTYKRFEIRINPEYFSNNDKIHLYSALVNRPAGFCHAVIPNNPKLLPLIKEIVAETAENAHHREEMLCLLFETFLIQLHRSVPSLFNNDDRKAELVHRICHTFETNLKKHYTLKSIAEENLLSEYYLSHIFKEITGYSVMEYLLSIRLANAKSLLSKTRLSINEIIETCGFSDNSNFARAFKMRNGISPSEFRKKYFHP